MKEILLQGRALCKAFSQNGVSTAILDRVDIDIFQHDFTVIMGPSGAGKSTLLYALSGMDRITDGKITYQGKTISRYSENQMARLRSQEFGFVFQQTHLVSNLSLYENVAVAGYVGKKRSPQEAAKRAEALLEQMNVGSAKDRFPAQVSGGEAQRAAIARAMINDPGLLFADEPTGALNKSNSEDVLNLLSQLNQSGQSILMVTHDVRAALRGNRILYLEDGKVLDELNLPVYDAGQLKERETQVNGWLSALQW